MHIKFQFLFYCLRTHNAQKERAKLLVIKEYNFIYDFKLYVYIFAQHLVDHMLFSAFNFQSVSQSVSKWVCVFFRSFHLHTKIAHINCATDMGIKMKAPYNKCDLWSIIPNEQCEMDGEREKKMNSDETLCNLSSVCHSQIAFCVTYFPLC